MATHDPAPHLNSLKVTSSSTPLLATHLTSSLTTLSYPPSTTSPVAALTARNTHTVTLSGLQSLLHHPSRTYGTAQALSHLFSDLVSKNVSFNTNEPVLVIHSNTLSGTHLTEIAAAAANLLRYQYHIRPVRIYAGNFAGFSASDSEAAVSKGFSGAEGYSLSLLNVVNTDIGGPGMVQLLDMVDWEAAGAVKMEVWDGSGWNLVREVEFEMKEEEEEEGGSEGGGTENGEWESESEVDAEPEPEDKAGHGQEAEADNPEEAPHDPVPGTNTDTETDNRPPLRSMKDPSWERSQDQKSLSDMITKQAKTSKLPVSKGGNAYASAAGIEKAGLEGEDEYEVV